MKCDVISIKQLIFLKRAQKWHCFFKSPRVSMYFSSTKATNGQPATWNQKAASKGLTQPSEQGHTPCRPDSSRRKATVWVQTEKNKQMGFVRNYYGGTESYSVHLSGTYAFKQHSVAPLLETHTGVPLPSLFTVSRAERCESITTWSRRLDPHTPHHQHVILGHHNMDMI